LNSLAGRLQSSHFGGEPDLIVVIRASEPHRLLVEGREAHRVDLAVARERECVPIIVEGESAAGLAGCTPFNGGGIEVSEIHKGGIAVDRSRIRSRRHRHEVRLDARDACPLVEDATVADHDETRAGAYLVEGNELRRQLGADAGGISIARQ
jgi:hypothetical protein